jgi:hypothetical protein
MLRRAVFSDFQRKGLEKRFQLQKYISKPDRKKLAEKLGLKDSQVWAGKRIFQEGGFPVKISYLLHTTFKKHFISQSCYAPLGENLVPEPAHEMEEQ